MSAYVYFAESTVYFTPNAVTLNGHEHVTIKVVTPRPFLRRHQYNVETGRHETTLYIPRNFTGKFVVSVSTDFPKRRKSASRLHRLGVSVEKGAIIGIVNLDSYRLPYVEVSFPSGYWGELGMNWQADDWEVWVDLPSGWDNE